MTSAALEEWRTERAALLNELFAAHELVRGPGPGRRWRTSELNRALLLRFAAQFQGFAKDLHQEAAVTFGSLAQPEDPTVALVIAAGLQTNRELDRGNAQEASLSRDFGRFGLKFWDEMDALSTRTARRREKLKWLNTVRNAVAHDDEVKLARARDAGYGISLVSLRGWRSALSGLAGTVDNVLAEHLAALFETDRPW